MIQLVIFDMAGTTVQDDDFVAECFIAALGERGVSITAEDARPVMGIPKPLAIKSMIDHKRSARPASSEEIESIHQSFIKAMIHLYQTDSRVKEIEGASAVFAKLRQNNIKIGLDTGFSRDIAQTIIDRLDWNEKIDASVTSDEVANGRPAPDMGLKLMAQLGIDDPQQLVKVGDTASDLGEGAALGVAYNIGVCSGAYSREQLAAEPHTHILDSIRELPAVLGLG
ncbi:MAG: HAD hydrolase-like protein [Bacteroidia bacterium]